MFCVPYCPVDMLCFEERLFLEAGEGQVCEINQ
jgi:hypothetical protein